MNNTQNRVDQGREEKVTYDIKHLVNTYDINKNLNFDGVVFRPKASRTVGFGIDISTPLFKLRTHNAVDSGKSSTTGLDIYAPFAITGGEWFPSYGTFGTLLILQTEYDFELRFAHMSEKEVAIMDKLKEGKEFYLPPKTFIGLCGNEGVGTGAHLHFEIVSKQEKSEILEELLSLKVKEKRDVQYSQKEILDLFAKRGLTAQEGFEILNNEKTRRGISFINTHKIIRKDYHTGKTRTFYSSLSCFSM